MASICLHLRAHQPDVLRPLRLRSGQALQRSGVAAQTYFIPPAVAADGYFDEGATIIRTADLVERTYQPAFALLEDLIEQSRGGIRVGLGLSGLLLDRLGDRHANIIDALRRLLATNAVELTNESYYHSPAWLYAEDEFKQQLNQHAERCQVLLGVRPKTVVDSIGGAGLGGRLATVLDPRSNAQTFIHGLITEQNPRSSHACALELESLGELGPRGFEFLSELVSEARTAKLRFLLPKEIASSDDRLASPFRTTEQRDLALTLFDLDQHVRLDPETLETWRRLQAVDHLRDQPEHFRTIFDHFVGSVRPHRRTASVFV